MIAQFSIYALDALLASTLVYLIVLMRKLKAFRRHEGDMRKVVDDIVSSTDSARDAMAKLKMSIMESQSTVHDQIGSAKQLIAELEKRMTEAQAMLATMENHSLAMARQATSQAVMADTMPARADISLQPRNKINLDEISQMTKSLRMKVATQP